MGFISSGSFPNRKPRKGQPNAFAGLFVMKTQGASLEIFMIIVYSSAVSRVQMGRICIEKALVGNWWIFFLKMLQKRVVIK